MHKDTVQYKLKAYGEKLETPVTRQSELYVDDFAHGEPDELQD